MDPEPPRLDDMYELAERENIHVMWENLLPAGESLYGLYLYYHGQYAILLDHRLRHETPFLRSVFGEELGHHFTAPYTSITSTHLWASSTYRTCNSIDEAHALRWAVNYLIPDLWLIRAFHEGLQTVSALAEYFTVTPWMMYRKMELMKGCIK